MGATAYEPRWASVDVLLQMLRHKQENVRQPEVLPRQLRAAEDFLDSHCRRQWRPEPGPAAPGEAAPAAGVGTPVTKTLYMPARAGRVPRLAIPDLRMASAVTVDGLALLPGTYGYSLDFHGEEPAKNIRLYTTPSLYTTQPRAITITGWWGWDVRPGEIEDAVYRLAARLYHERAATYSDAVLLPEGGVLQYFRQLPPSVQGAVAAWRVPLAPGFVRAA